MIRAVPDLARKLAGRLDALFTHDATLAQRLNDAQRRLQNANDRLWRGAHPDGLAALYGEHPAAVDVAFAEHRSEVLGSADRLAAIQQVHCKSTAPSSPTKPSPRNAGSSPPTSAS